MVVWFLYLGLGKVKTVAVDWTVRWSLRAGSIPLSCPPWTLFSLTHTHWEKGHLVCEWLFPPNPCVVVWIVALSNQGDWQEHDETTAEEGWLCLFFFSFPISLRNVSSPVHATVWRRHCSHCHGLEGVGDAVYVLKAQIELINKNLSNNVYLFYLFLFFYCVFRVCSNVFEKMLAFWFANLRVLKCQWELSHWAVTVQ